MGGRGSGKTRAGAEWIADCVARRKMRRIALVGATHNDARSVMIEGESGLLRASRAAQYEPSNRRIIWPSGAIATVLSAEEPDSFRGHQFDGAWADEFCKWADPQGALDMLEMCLRLGNRPRLLITTTPRAIKPLENLIAMKGVALAQSTTRDNALNLAPGFMEAMEARYGGTRLGRQELEAELIEDNADALWKREWIEQTRVAQAPELTRIVLAVDPPVVKDAAECGIVIAGVDAKGEGYVLADYSCGGKLPHEWSARVGEAFEAFQADIVVAEANQGGEMVREVLTRATSNLPLKLVHASRDKRTRASPASLLYQQGRVHHAGRFAELEDQLCQFDGNGGPSPDRLDALVWALAELFPILRQTEPRVRNL